MKNDTISISRFLLMKVFILSFILLAIAFTAGIILGKSDRPAIERTSADSSDIQEQLSDCSYKLQEITAKHLDMIKIAQDKGLLDTEGKFNPEIACALPEKKQEQENTAENDINNKSGNEENRNETKDEVKISNDKVPFKPEKADEAIATVPPKNIKQEHQKIETETKHSSSEVQPVAEKTTKVEKKCLYSIQLFSGTSREQALAAQKRYHIVETRLVEGIVKEKSWYRIRYGCFSTKAEAEKFLPGIKDEIEEAIVVSE